MGATASVVNHTTRDIPCCTDSSAASLAYATSVFTTIKNDTHDMQSSGNKVTGVSGIRCMCCGDGVETYRERALIKQFNRIII